MKKWLLLGIVIVGLLLWKPQRSYTDCIAKVTIIFTSPEMVNEMCFDFGVKDDNGKPLSRETTQILGCANGVMVILPNTLDAAVVVHELQHVIDWNCPGEKSVTLIKQSEKKDHKKK